MFRIGVDKLNPLWYNKEKKKGENKMCIELDKFLTLIVKNNSWCRTCELNHSGICFFAFDCITQDFVHYLEIEEE